MFLHLTVMSEPLLYDRSTINILTASPSPLQGHLWRAKNDVANRSIVLREFVPLEGNSTNVENPFSFLRFPFVVVRPPTRRTADRKLNDGVTEPFCFVRSSVRWPVLKCARAPDQWMDGLAVASLPRRPPPSLIGRNEGLVRFPIRRAAAAAATNVGSGNASTKCCR